MHSATKLDLLNIGLNKAVVGRGHLRTQFRPAD